MGSSPHISLEEARRLVAELTSSGQSAASFARQAEIPVGRLYYYRRRVRLADQAQASDAGFRELRCAGGSQALPLPSSGNAGLHVEVGGLCSLAIGDAHQASLAAAFVRALSGEASPSC